MTVVSVDLAYKRFADIGFCILTDRGADLEAKFPSFSSVPDDPPSPEVVADLCIEQCEAVNARFVLLDGPQGWKDEDNGLEHSRVCERTLNTPAKCGLPGIVKPANYLPFVRFSIAVFDALEHRGWCRLRTDAPAREDRRVAVESFPLAAWRTLGLRPLPAKARCRADDLADRLGQLRSVFALRLARDPNHDELQALVAGLAGLGLERGSRNEFAVAGTPPFRKDGTWREGLIINPVRRAIGPPP